VQLQPNSVNGLGGLDIAQRGLDLNGDNKFVRITNTSGVLTFQPQEYFLTLALIGRNAMLLGLDVDGDLELNFFKITDIANQKVAGMQAVEDRVTVLENALTAVTSQLAMLSQIFGKLGYRSYRERPEYAGTR